MSIRLRACGPTAGDCTTPYNVIIEGDYTVAQFIEEIDGGKDDGNWGTVRVKHEPFWVGGETVCDYGRGNAIKYTNKYDKCVVVSARAHGGWSNYDFYLHVK